MNPGYKNSLVGLIPKDWDHVQVGSIASVKGGKRLPSGHVLQDSPTPHPYVRVCDMIPSGVDASAIRYVPLAAFPQIQGYRIYTTDIFISVAGTLGIVGVVPPTLDGANLTENADRLTELRCDRDFLMYWLMSNRIQDEILTIRTVGAQPKLALGRIAQFDIALPKSVSEQRVVAVALRDVDALLGALDRLIAKKRDIKQAAMQQLLTGQTRLPGFAGEWEVKRLGDVGKCLRGVSYKGDNDLSFHEAPHTNRLLRSNNVQSSIVVTGEVQFVNSAKVAPCQILHQGDILICMANGSKNLVGKAGRFTITDGYEYTFGAFMGCFRTSYSKANPAFVFYLFLSARYRDYISNQLAGSSINNLRPSSVESLQFSMPPRLEQASIVAVLSNIDAELEALGLRRTKTASLKQGMMQELLTGRTRLV